MARVTFWRPRIGLNCAADVRVQILDLESGDIISKQFGSPQDGQAMLFETRVNDPKSNVEPETRTRVLGARVVVAPAPATDSELPACKATFPFRLTLQTTDIGGKATTFYEGWPCKWYVPDFSSDQ